MKTILVTGGAGYIGSHISKALARAGYQPVAFDNLSTGHRWAVRWGPLVVGNVEDRPAVRKALEETRAEAVIHCAANALVGESMENPYKYLHDNVVGSLALLEALHETRVPHLVFSSTCATYGEPLTPAISEEHVQSPTNPYGESKLFMERCMKWYERIHGISWISLRYFNAAGADAESEIGESHLNETHLIPLVIEATLGSRSAVRVMGQDYPTPDGTAIRDYIHVEDLADAHLKAMQYLFAGGKSLAFNLGIERGYSVREVIQAVEQVSARKVPRTDSGRRPGDPAVLVATTALARNVLSWTPRYQTIEGIIDTAWRWHVHKPARTVSSV